MRPQWSQCRNCGLADRDPRCEVALDCLGLPPASLQKPLRESIVSCLLTWGYVLYAEPPIRAKLCTRKAQLLCAGFFVRLFACQVRARIACRIRLLHEFIQQYRRNLLLEFNIEVVVLRTGIVNNVNESTLCIRTINYFFHYYLISEKYIVENAK